MSQSTENGRTMRRVWQSLTIGLSVHTGTGANARTWQVRGAFVPFHAEATKIGPVQFYVWKGPWTRVVPPAKPEGDCT